MCAHASRSASASVASGPSWCRVGRVARPGGELDRVPQERRAGGDGGELLGELAEAEVGGALAHEAERGGVPEGRGAAVAERHLVSVGEGEQLAQAGADLAHERLHGPLAVGGAHHRGAIAGEPRERLGAHLRRPAAEAPVARLQLVGDDQRRLLCQGARRHVGSSLYATSTDWSVR